MRAGHYSENDLTLYYYGEGRGRDRIERHLQQCAACAALYRDIGSTLGLVVAPEVPERGDQYGLEVWQRIRHRLPERDTGFAGFARFGRFSGFHGFFGFAGVAAAVVLLVAASAAVRWALNAPGAGNLTKLRNGQNLANPVNPPNPENRANPANPANLDILLSSVAEHFDRSERVLTDIMHAGAHDDISAEQRWAEDLVTTSRLYRQDALDAGESSIAGVLDDLERSLLEIVHSPSTISAADLEQLRRRIDAAALLFKVRVMSDELRRREESSAEGARPRPTPSRIS